MDWRGANNSASLEIAVGRSALIALIDGGDRNAGVGETITLDAAASFDPDKPSAPDTSLSDGEDDDDAAQDENTRFLFSWTCGASSSALCDGAPLSTSAAFSKPLRAFGVGTHVFAVVMSDRDNKDGSPRNASASVTIDVAVDSPPPVSIGALSLAKVPWPRRNCLLITEAEEYCFIASVIAHSLRVQH